MFRLAALYLDSVGCAGYCSAAVGAYFGAQNGGGWKGAIIGGVSAYYAYQFSPAGSYGTGYGQAAVSGFFTGFGASGGNFKAGFRGAFTAVAFHWAGEESWALNKTEQTLVHGVVGCVTSAASGARCSEGFLSASFSKAATVNGSTPKGGAGLVVSAAVGGTAAALGGGNFANGAVTAAFGYMFNCLASRCNSTDYDLDDTSSHISKPLQSPVLCNVSTPQCIETARAVLGCQSAPGQFGCTGVGEERPYNLTGFPDPNPITQYRPSLDMIINGTSKGHMFHDGYVVRWLATDQAGNVTIWTAGAGTNSSPAMAALNTYLGKKLFVSIGTDNADLVKKCIPFHQRGQRC